MEPCFSVPLRSFWNLELLGNCCLLKEGDRRSQRDRGAWLWSLRSLNAQRLDLHGLFLDSFGVLLVRIISETPGCLVELTGFPRFCWAWVCYFLNLTVICWCFLFQHKVSDCLTFVKNSSAMSERWQHPNILTGKQRLAQLWRASLLTQGRLVLFAEPILVQVQILKRLLSTLEFLRESV